MHTIINLSRIMKGFSRMQIVSVIVLLIPITSFCQTPPEEFFKGLDLFEVSPSKAKAEFQQAVKKDSLFHGSYHFLGVIYLNENQLDSAIYNFRKAVSLNKQNANHTREMAYVRLIDTYMLQADLSNAFNAAWEAYLYYPDNKVIERYVKDVCLWSFYLSHTSLDPSYLQKELQEQYIVNSVDQEYLIIRRIEINGQRLVPAGQRLVQKKKTSYDIISCQLSDSDKTTDVVFKLNWDLRKDFGGSIPNTTSVYENLENPIYERIGALLVSDPKQDIKKAVEEILGSYK